MRWPWRRHATENREDPGLLAAQERLEEIERRAARVIPELYARRNRNHWGDTIAAITQRRTHP